MQNLRSYYPNQRVSDARKREADWYANSIDYIIDAGLACNNRDEIEVMTNILHGDIPQEYYKKTLNPYNASQEKHKRFPATMRNFDIMSDIIRRYVSEYFKGVHEFIVGADDPDIAIKKNAKLNQEIMIQCMQAFEQQLQQALQQQTEQGVPPEQIDPQSLMPDIDEFIKNFEANYVDEETTQGQKVLEYVRSMTEDLFIYMSAFFDYVSYGEAYTYSEVRGTTINKEHVSPIDAYPIPNSNFFVEDHDMFARRMMLSYEQIINMFDDDLDERDRKFLEEYYNTNRATGKPSLISYDQYHGVYADACQKFTDEERDFYRKSPYMIRDVNTNLYEVWHVVWRGQEERGILTYVNEMGMETTMVVPSDFKMDPSQGHIKLEFTYEEQIYEGYRIGTRHTGIYPIKARAIPYGRGGKLPYNGIMEILPGFGKFSVIKIISPLQVLRNIISYHREMVIAKNKLLILLMPQSLIEDDAEDRIYKMAADGVLMYDDSEDSNSLKAQQIRLLNASLGNYITELTQLLTALKEEARELVDMNAQRYGQIHQSAGKAVTDEAVARSSMGSVILFTMFDEMRCRDYNRDIDYGKFAFIDGLDTRYWDKEGNHAYLSLDVNSYVNSELSVTCRNNQKELDKLHKLQDWAFAAAQNGDLMMAVEAITNDNVSSIKSAVNRWNEIKMQHENELKQADQELEQAREQFEMMKIQAQGDQDRQTLITEYQLKSGLAYDTANANAMTTPDTSADSQAQHQANVQAEANRNQEAREKLNLEYQKLQAELYNKAADRQVKREEMQNQLKIARTNKNRYDK